MKGAGKIVHPYRDVKDVLVSVFFYHQHIAMKSGKPPPKETFSEFLRRERWHPVERYRNMSQVQYWKYHLESWKLQKDVFHMSFEDIIEDTENTLYRLSEFLGIPLNPLRKPFHRWWRPKTVFFRKGKPGDWKNHFSEEDLAYVQGELAKEVKVDRLDC